MRTSRLADLIILSAIAWLGFMIVYRVISQYTALDTKSFVINYLIPIVFLAFLIASLKRKKVFKKKLSLVLLSTALTVYFIEALLVLHYRKAPTPFLRSSKKLGNKIDTRTKLDLFEEYRSKGIEIWPRINPKTLGSNFRVRINGKEILPLGGISNVNTILSNENPYGQYIFYQSDEHGFMNPKGLYDTERISIGIVGDSFAQGYCVKPEKNVAALIRQIYPNTLNLGFGKNGPLEELATIKEYLMPLKPKVVLWLYFEGNDLRDLEDEKKNDLLLKYVYKDHNQDLLSVQPEIDRQLKKAAIELAKRAIQKRKKISNILFKFLVLEKIRYRLWILKQVISYPFDAILFHKILASAKDTISSWDGRLYFVYLPSWQRFKYPDTTNPYRDQVLTLVNDLKIPIIDICEVFSSHDDPLSLFPLRFNAHYNEKGYKLVADTIIQFIEQKGSLKSQ